MTDEKGEVFFVGKDVATTLGYSDSRKAIRVHVDEEDKGVGGMATPGGKQEHRRAGSAVHSAKKSEATQHVQPRPNIY